jgi:hypothetical protein
MSEEIKSDAKKFWFPAKKFGYGWGPPNCWQGWLVILAYIALLLGGSFLLRPDRHLALFLAYTAILTAALIIICYLKGEKAGWRWGGKFVELFQQRAGHFFISPALSSSHLSPPVCWRPSR